MKKIERIFKADWVVPIVSLILVLVSFAIVLPSLRFYLDDWPQLYSYLVRGEAGLKQFFLHDGRPFGYWPHLLFLRLWGINPILLHLTNYVLRWLVGLFMWWILIVIWPQNKREVAWAVLLYAVFPSFWQQSMGVVFIPHWMCHLLFFISLYLMVLGVKNRKYRWLFFLLSLAVDVPNLFTYEYFIGLEFLRPVLIWFLLEEQKISSRIKKILVLWLPFLVLSLGYIYWRLFVMTSLRAGTSSIILANLLTAPLQTIEQILTFTVQDFLYMVFGVWNLVIDPQNFDFTARAKTITTLITILVMAAFFAAIWLETKMRGKSEEQSQPEKSVPFWIGAMVVGFLGFAFGCAPAWMIGHATSDSSGLWNDRFGFGAMFAACIFMVGLLDLLFSHGRLKREIILILLIGLSVGRNINVTNEYKWSSTYQNRFYWQLKWRAPSIDANTTILADHEMFSKVGVYPTSFALNLLYPSQQPMPALDYWFFTLYMYFPDPEDQLGPGTPIEITKWFATYNAQSENSLVIDWQPSELGCLWVLSENDRNNPYLSPIVVDTLPISNLDRIQADIETPEWMVDLFGKEDRNTWCYYFETADMNRQMGNWDEIPALYEEAGENGYSPVIGTELMPFIEGYAHVGDTDKALELTDLANIYTIGMHGYLCDNWIRIAGDLADDVNVQSAFQQVQEKFGCEISGE